MKFARSLSLSLALAAFGVPAGAAKHDQHQGHHPASATSAAASKAKSSKAGPEMARLDIQMKAMREMHDKMTAAQTPEARNALMAEHMKVMQDGMTMMNGMSPGGMADVKGDMAAHHRMMEKRMEMMQSTMQMMMDRLPAAPAK